MTGFGLPDRWPLPADDMAASALQDDLLATLTDRLPAAIDRGPIAAMLACLGGNSRHLADLARREHDTLRQLVRQGPDRALASSLGALRRLHPATDRADIAASLRQAKRRVALITAVADLGGMWDLARITGTLSLLAEAALRVSVAHLLVRAASGRQIRLPDPTHPERGSGFIVLGMGKLGARELNYSSDIDLVLLFDQEMQADMPEAGSAFARIATGLVSLMEARDADGYVFRTDLRLRPDPASTPPAVSLAAAITYYESSGQTWERAAMIKARPVAGDLAAGQRFLDTIRPFVWRRHLDFAAIDDIHTMKRRIDRNKPAPAASFQQRDADDPVAGLLGHDVKLGHGGIREIEFIAQALQLVWAGRAPDLRDPTTQGALARLARATHLKRDTATGLSNAYAVLRTVEHRLQMRDDRQTHQLPSDHAGFEAFARFMGAADGAALARSLAATLRRTRRHFEAMFRNQGGDLAEPPETFDPTLPGFGGDRRTREILHVWQTDRYRALAQPRARASLQRLMPALLSAFEAQPDPHAALVRFDTLLSRQNAGVQLLSLFEHAPALAGRIVGILGASPALGDHLAAVPEALDGLLEAEAHLPANRAVLGQLDRQMRAASGVEEAIRIARTLVRGEEFRLSVAQLEGTLDIDRAGLARTRLATRVIGHLLRHVLAAHRQRYGTIPGGAISVVALGAAGAREMMSGSDLDLMLVYDHPPSITQSQGIAQSLAVAGSRSVPASVWFARLAHALIAALSAPGVEGPLYALDMRLRPSGSKGPVAVSLDSFRRYHRENSRTWERMALSRARVVAGPDWLRRTVRDAMTIAMQAGNGPALIKLDAAAMRARLSRELPARGPWDVKRRLGGLTDVQFIAQTLQLCCPDAAIHHPTTRVALRRLARAGWLSPDERRRLVAADRFWRTVQGRLRLLLGTATPSSLDTELPPAAAQALLLGLDTDPPGGLDGLAASCDAMSAMLQELFARLVGPLPTAPDTTERETGR